MQSFRAAYFIFNPTEPIHEKNTFSHFINADAFFFSGKGSFKVF
jgi:hypothetical protein